jgi:hypothetical protein
MIKEVCEFRALSVEEINYVAGGTISGTNVRINKNFQLTTAALVAAAALVKGNTAQAEADANAYGYDTFTFTTTNASATPFSSTSSSNSVAAVA